MFDSFVPRRSIIYFKEWGQTPMYSHVAVVAGVKKYRVPKIECPGAVLNDTVGTSAFCQGHDLLRVCLWKGGSLLSWAWRTVNVLSPVFLAKCPGKLEPAAGP